MSTQTLTIQEFLDARWREEDAAWAGWTQPGLSDLSRMMRADIAAKRAILAMHIGHHECPSAEDNCGWWTSDCPTARLLAEPYRAHPDWREEFA